MGAATVRTIWAPESTRGFLAPKGSVAVNGVSLTVVDSHTDRFSVSLVPFTLSASTLGTARSGDEVNLECDVLARYINHLLRKGSTEQGASALNSGSGLLDKLESFGF